VLRSSDDAAYTDVDLDLVGMVAIGGHDIPRPCGSLPEEREREGGSTWESRQRGCGWVDIEWTRGGPGTGGLSVRVSSRSLAAAGWRRQAERDTLALVCVIPFP
jgi:hypothetical protein